MTRMTLYYCPTCRKPLDFGLGYLKDGNLLVDCNKCEKTVCIEHNVKCKECAELATHFFTKGLSPVYAFYFCDEHFTDFRKKSKKAKNKTKAFILPAIGTGLIIVSFFEEFPTKPFLPFMLAGIFCWVVAIASWKSLRTSLPANSEEEDSDV